ncbi:MAG: lysylphosphatidylglycerol synthase transmembrane domain-containing protein [Candidatus Tantalella remota]|nr:lysylphosphatidylglycerol synthase transmembrane domain-containing protein [Candidatus Tantalella remota]
MKKYLSTLVRVVVSFGLLGFLFWFMRGEFEGIMQTMAGCSVGLLLSAALLFLGMVLALSWRLKVVFDGEDLVLPFSEALQLTLVGYFFNNFMPTAVGGDIIKAHYAGRFNGKKLPSYASVLMDRLIGLFTILIIAGVALFVDRGRFQVGALKPLVMALLALGISGFVIATNRTVAVFMERLFAKMKMFGLGERFRAIYSIVHDYRNRHSVVIKASLLSGLAQCTYYVIVFMCFTALGKNVPLGNVFLIMPVVIFISMVPSIGGLGVREGAMLAFFAPLAGRETAFAVSLLVLAGLFIVSIFGGMVYLWWGAVRGEGIKGAAEEGEEEMGEIASREDI